MRYAEEIERILCGYVVEACMLPFAGELMGSKLSRSNWRQYYLQDAIYFDQYCRTLARAIDSDTSFECRQQIAQLLHTCLVTYQPALLEACERLGIQEAHVRTTAAQPACTSYVSHLARIARTRSALTICSALIPCSVGYVR
ncbi:MAG: hypothetical protein AAFY15_13465, partial [Cyanobacteria bacterium J06648_11]